MIIEEDPIEMTVDSQSGLTKDVVSALQSQRLVLPEIAKGFADKYPFRGLVVSKGDLCRYQDVQIGTRVMFPRLGGMRWSENDKQYINIRECDLHAIVH